MKTADAVICFVSFPNAKEKNCVVCIRAIHHNDSETINQYKLQEQINDIYDMNEDSNETVLFPGVGNGKDDTIQLNKRVSFVQVTSNNLLSVPPTQQASQVLLPQSQLISTQNMDLPTLPDNEYNPSNNDNPSQSRSSESLNQDIGVPSTGNDEDPELLTDEQRALGMSSSGIVDTQNPSNHDTTDCTDVPPEVQVEIQNQVLLREENSRKYVLMLNTTVQGSTSTQNNTVWNCDLPDPLNITEKCGFTSTLNHAKKHVVDFHQQKTFNRIAGDQSTCEPINVFTCDQDTNGNKCGMIFLYAKDCDDHEATKHGVKPKQCVFCNKYVKTDRYMKNHLKTCRYS